MSRARFVLAALLLTLLVAAGYKLNRTSDADATGENAGTRTAIGAFFADVADWAPTNEALVETPMPEVNVAPDGSSSDVTTTPVTQAAASSGTSSMSTSEMLSMRPFAIQSVDLVSQLTGHDSPARTDERWNITGTDLGFNFRHNDQMYLVFGDTWGRGGVEGRDWRSNVMAVAEPHPEYGYVLSEAITDDNGEAKELLASRKEPGNEYTVIPTTGVAFDDRMYLHYMSIRDWVPSGTGYKHPDVNGAGFAYSDDDGQTWVKDERASWSGDTGFTQAAIVQEGEYVYVFGTPAGRYGALKLLRVPGGDLLQPEQYRYWSGEGWSDAADDAVEVVPAPVGELSVRWSPFHERWLMMYRNEEADAIMLRTAESLTGTWDDERVVLTGEEYPTHYAPFMFPISGPEVYFAMSIFSPDYQVYIMRLTLSP